VVAADVEASEAELLAGAQGGNLFAFEEIVRRYQRRVYATALRIVRRHDLADDVTQETFVRAHRALATYDPARPFGPWICRIARNLAINHVRSPQAREEPLDEAAREASAAPAHDGPLSAVLEGEARAVLDRAVGQLPPDQRAVFVLRAYDELSYAEIAEALGLSIGTVMSRLSRAREKLRAALAGYLGPAMGRAGAAR
jgi:RNA polymerase sigma-70 factor (ECF subfamily)